MLSLFVYAILFALAWFTFSFCLWFLHPVINSYKARKKPPHSQEQTYPNPNCVSDDQKYLPFASIEDTPSCELSVIIPAYNEENRLHLMLDETLNYLENRLLQNPDFSYELIIVDDGSTDQTVSIVMKYIKMYSCKKIRLLKLVQNHGKGGAIRKGMLRASGRYLLMADADGATCFEDIEKLEKKMKIIKSETASGCLCIGSRAHLEDEAIAKRHPIRNFLMHGFHFLVSCMCSISVRDSQCGFKLFDRSSARILFRTLHIERWAFDVELLYLAQLLKLHIHEIGVRWTEIPGSKLDIVTASLTMLREIFLIRFCYFFNIWRIEVFASPISENSADRSRITKQG